MIDVLDVIVLILAVIVLIPFAVLVAECMLALFPRRSRAFDSSTVRPRCAVVIPAHDEEAGIAATLATIVPQLDSQDQLIVVADNCSDGTATAARSAGATVIERTDPQRRGKGFALDFGIQHLRANPPDIVVFFDADCAVRDGCIDLLIREAAARNRPVQAVYLMKPPAGSTSPKARLSAFAFQFKNQVRPMGLHRLGFPCLLTGTGMAFPWPIISATELATADIVEDMKIGLDLAVAGSPPTLCPDALVTSELPATEGGAHKQRTRWEHGHVLTILRQVPRLLGAGLSRLRFDLLGLALELAVPPLALLLLVWMAVLAVSLAVWLMGGSLLSVVLLLAGLGAFFLALLASWAKFARQELPLITLLGAPMYILWKLPIYCKLLIGRAQGFWNRAERTAPSASQPVAEAAPAESELQ